jgi:hypothetical protein
VKPDEDTQHLRLLSIFHYVVAGMLAVISMFPIIHLTLGIAIVAGAFDDIDNGTPPPAIFGWMFIVIPGTFILCGLAMAICSAIAGRRLSQSRGYMYCLVIAGLECMFMPVGTVLGVFTIIVLMRPTVRERFCVAEP